MLNKIGFDMKKKICFLLISTIILNSKTYGENEYSKWQLPDSSRRYHEVTFLTAHNAFSNVEDGYIQPQQQWSLEKQLEMGIRGFMLDTHYYRQNNKKRNQVYLCHGSCRLTRYLLRPFKGEPPTLTGALEIIKNFLSKNKKEIITIFLENYTKKDDLDIAIKEAKIDKYILKPTDWNPEKNMGWPTLKYLQEKNKRLIIFNQTGETKYAYDEWTNHSENQWGTICFNKACQERKESAKCNKLCERYLHVLNFFPHFYVKSLQRINFAKINCINLKNFINEQITNGLDKKKVFKNRYPNFIALDFVNEGNPMELVNEINSKANRKRERRKMFRKITN